MRLPKYAPPVPPGGLLQREFMEPLGMTQERLAAHLGWTKTKVNQIIRGKRAITPATALCLADAFGTTAEFWLNAQMACDLWAARAGHKTVARVAKTLKGMAA